MNRYQPGKFGTVPAGRVDEGYYLGLNVVPTPEAAARKVDELAWNPDRPLLLPLDDAERCALDPELRRRFLSVLFLYPYGGRIRHSEAITEPLCKYIETHYRQVPERAHFGYGVWARK